MGVEGHDGFAVPGRVVLAREAPFKLGRLDVEPALCEVRYEASRETLQPRVMQVLVALARAGSSVVTRDDLIEQCWGGRIVGEDSINRVLSRIRRLASDLGGESFAIETIPRVGYRLVGEAEDRGTDSARQPRFAAPRPLDRRAVIGAALAIGTVAVAGAALLTPRASPNPLPEAKALYERAIAIRSEGPAANRQALAYLREAVRLSPEYGLAWGALALAYGNAISNEAPERVSGFEERLLEAARNAELHDPGNADAATALLPAGNGFGRWSQYEPIYRSAIERNPEHVAGYALLGTLLMDVGRWSDAVDTLRLAAARNSSSAVLRYKLIVALWAAGQISVAEDEIDRAMRLWPQHGAIWQTKIKLMSLTGRAREALALARDPAARPLDEHDAPNHEGRLLYLSALATRSAGEVEQAVASILVTARRVEMERLNAALQVTALGGIGLALDLLEGVYLRSGEWALKSVPDSALATHPLFQPHAAPLWREPRFNRILARVGLERYWRLTGRLPDYRRSAGWPRTA